MPLPPAIHAAWLCLMKEANYEPSHNDNLSGVE
jgi:hypothetical protein